MKIILTFLMCASMLTSAQTPIKGKQCNGITKAGAQCKKITRDQSGFCFMHNPAKKRGISK